MVRLGWDGSVLDDARGAAAVEPVAALQELQLDEEGEAHDLALESLDELDRAMDGPACREEIVHDQHLLAWGDRVSVDLECVRAVLEGVFDGDGLRRQLAQLADRDESGIELIGHRGAEDEAA